MAGPWEKYQQAEPGPWAKYGATAVPADQPSLLQSLSNTSRAFQTGADQGMTLGFGDEINAGLMTPIQAAIDAAQGKGFDLGASYNRALSGERGLDTRDAALNPAADAAGQIVGALTTGGTLAKGGVTLMNAAQPTVASLLPRAAAEGAIYGGVNGFGSGDSFQDRLGKAVEDASIGGALGAGTGGVFGMLAQRAAAKAVPSVEDLKGQADALYKAAEARGVHFPQPAVKQMVDEMTAQAITDGIDPTLHPGATAALKRAQDFAQTGMTVPNTQTLRRIIAGAMKDPTNPDQTRIAGPMLDKIDGFAAQGAPELEAARGVYRQAKKGEMIEQAIELAGSRAGQFSGSGYENALRTEFRNLERQIIKGQIKGISPEESAAISKVARGGPVENVARWVGKAAPTGIVSFGASAGVPYMIGNSVGGPAMGAAAAGTTMGAGIAGRTLATALAAHNAGVAGALMRNGGPITGSTLSPVKQAILQALIAAEGNRAPAIADMLSVPFSAGMTR